MDYNLIQDIEIVLTLTGLTTEELAGELGVSRMSIYNWLSGKSKMNDRYISIFYEYAYAKGLRLNKIKEQFYREEEDAKRKSILFHGAKTELVGKIRIDCNKEKNDLGNGFYCGETMEQSAMFVASYPKSSLYMLSFDPRGLKKKIYKADREWMLLIAYYRGKLKHYENSKLIKSIERQFKSIDYIVAPIADNRMFELIDEFTDGEITDVQCEHCISATDLGKQIVIISEKAAAKTQILEKCFLANAEKSDYLYEWRKRYELSRDKVKLAKKQYRNKGRYIEDIFDETN